MMQHLGGPESAGQIADRQRRYVERDSRQFRIVLEETDEGVGWVGYWEREWQQATIFEIGWSVVFDFQGRGIATNATAQAVLRARSERLHRHLHAFPAVNNTASNSVCRKVGFTLLGDLAFEYPPGNIMRCNDWILELFD